MQTLLVTNNTAVWSFLNHVTSVVDVSNYLFNPLPIHQSVQIINLCEQYQYQSIGYYVSLVAEARLNQVSPSIRHIQDTNTAIFKHLSQAIDQDIQDAFKNITQKTTEINLYFGQSPQKNSFILNEKLHHLFPFHLIRFEFEKKNTWVLKKLIPLTIETIAKDDITFMQNAAIHYFTNPAVTQMDLNSSIKKSFNNGRFNVAILVDPVEGETAPSNTKALEHFITAGQTLGLNVDIVTKQDAHTIANYDALFIRTTTSVNHYTYQIARNALQDHLVVIDDPQSIIRCTNKVYLAELFAKHQLLTPPTQLVSKYDTQLPPINFPCVVKKPDSSCSLGVVKINDLDSLKTTLHEFFKTSDIVIIQAFMPTEFDWRIGVIDHQPIYACRYYMAKNHWQIVNWANDDRLIHDAVPLDEVPKDVLELALKATQLIGNGFYGVDIKCIDNKAYIIEINDNPSVNHGIDDILLKDTLYEKIMTVFLERIQHEKQIQNHYKSVIPVPFDSLPHNFSN